MFFFRFGKDKNVVEVNHTKVINEALKGMVDVGLEGGGCIGETKRQNKIFKMTVSGLKSSFPFVALTDSNPVVGIPKVNLGEDNRAVEAVQQLADQWERISVLDSNGV